MTDTELRFASDKHVKTAIFRMLAPRFFLIFSVASMLAMSMKKVHERTGKGQKKGQDAYGMGSMECPKIISGSSDKSCPHPFAPQHALDG